MRRTWPNELQQRWKALSSRGSLRFLRFAVSAGVMALLFVLIDTNAILARLRTADLGWLLASLISMTALTFLMARRWQLTAQALDIALPYRRAVSEYYIAQLLNLILPGGMVGDAARAARLRTPGGLRQSAQSVALERIVGQSTLFILMFFGFLFAMFLPGGADWPGATWFFLALGVLIAGLIWGFAQREGRVARFLVLAISLMRRPQQIVLSVTIAGLIIFSFYACARATGTQLPANMLLTLIPLILTAMLVPLSVGGWGWREGAAAAFFPFAGALPSAGVAASIAYGTIMLVAAMPAVVFLLVGQGRVQVGSDEPSSTP